MYIIHNVALSDLEKKNHTVLSKACNMYNICLSSWHIFFFVPKNKIKTCLYSTLLPNDICVDV